jgi:hypothetical protein
MFQFTPEEKQDAYEKYFNKDESMQLIIFPKKQKQKYLCLLWIVTLFEKNIDYSEKQVNEILKKVYPDYVMVRRYLVDYNLMFRTDNGSRYWV